ncbi:hypothetical protein EJB05_03809 [Eragrostis curvula]|uniref:Uncharacterized protein n=1 Tax=Eragrostis curvula TaxID=38414 RepID=A0A5J9SVK3_9POAL|nr:hypothetical protein EJB05_51499 [Eragrostis curvula]TVU44372.1 hypothetical protein EJB05_03809 [Eragrostis curvula]
MAPKIEKQKKRFRAEEGRNLLPAAAAAGSNWVDQDRQEPKKRPWGSRKDGEADRSIKAAVENNIH